jgi:hypothetical protein
MLVGLQRALSVATLATKEKLLDAARSDML